MLPGRRSLMGHEEGASRGCGNIWGRKSKRGNARVELALVVAGRKAKIDKNMEVAVGDEDINY